MELVAGIGFQDLWQTLRMPLFNGKTSTPLIAVVLLVASDARGAGGNKVIGENQDPYPGRYYVSDKLK